MKKTKGAKPDSLDVERFLLKEMSPGQEKTFIASAFSSQEIGEDLILGEAFMMMAKKVLKEDGEAGSVKPIRRHRPTRKAKPAPHHK